MMTWTVAQKWKGVWEVLSEKKKSLPKLLKRGCLGFFPLSNSLRRIKCVELTTRHWKAVYKELTALKNLHKQEPMGS